jgi:hypothetical protein
MDGEVKKVGIRANTTWEVTGVNDPDGIIANPGELIGKTGGLNTSAEGEDLSFRIADRMDNISSAMPTATIFLRNALGAIFNVDINALTAYAVDNLLVWPLDKSIGPDDSWYTFADVPYGTIQWNTPPEGPRNTDMDPRSCASLDPSDRDLWRLPTRDEMFRIIADFRANGGYDKYGMANVDYSGMENEVHGYWTASSGSGPALPDFATYNTVNNSGLSLPVISKTHKGGTYNFSSGTFYLHVRCVRTK